MNARNFLKQGGSKDNSDKNIKAIKEKTTCSQCKKHGKTVYGHWAKDAECPYNKNKALKDDKKPREAAVTQRAWQPVWEHKENGTGYHEAHTVDLDRYH